MAITEASQEAADTAEEPIVAPAKRKRGRLIAIVVGAVVAAALLFGGGLLVGLTIPSGGSAGFSQGDFPGGGPQGGGLPPAGGTQQAPTDEN